ARKNSVKRGFPSLLSFTRLCWLHLLSCKVEQRGLGHLDWWPWASQEELMIFQPYMEKRPWNIVSGFPRYKLCNVTNVSRMVSLVTTGYISKNSIIDSFRRVDRHLLSGLP